MNQFHFHIKYLLQSKCAAHKVQLSSYFLSKTVSGKFVLIGTSLKFRASIYILAQDPLNWLLLSSLSLIEQFSQLNCVYIN